MTFRTRVREFFASERFKPPLVGIVRRYKELKKTDRKEAGNEAGIESFRYVTRILAALLINRVTANYFGVGSWDPKMEGAERMVTDTSPLAMGVSTAIASSIPSHYAHPLIAAEFALCAIRIWVEQKTFERIGITPDPAGTLLTPFSAGILEFVWKTGDLLKGYGNERQSILIAVNGMFGNVIRIIESVGLLALHNCYNDLFESAGKMMKDR